MRDVSDVTGGSGAGSAGVPSSPSLHVDPDPDPDGDLYGYAPSPMDDTEGGSPRSLPFTDDEEEFDEEYVDSEDDGFGDGLGDDEFVAQQARLRLDQMEMQASPVQASII